MNSSSDVIRGRDVIRGKLEIMLGQEVTSLRRIGGRRNSRVYLVETPGNRFAAKFHFRRDAHGPRHCRNEFRALSFLHRHGLRNVPRPIGLHLSHDCGIYQYLDGVRLSAGKADREQLDQFIAFLMRLARLSATPPAEHLPPASDACLRPDLILGIIERRLARLTKALKSAPAPEVSRFLRTEFRPALRAFVSVFRRNQSLSLPGLARLLPRRNRILSPSDFGFYNALRSSDGIIRFCDFEYFGWDDPAKMIVDFLLHPKNRMNRALKRYFLDSLVSGLKQPGLLERVRAIYPLHGLNWCLIMLNEFIPGATLVEKNPVTRERTKKRQLDKARALCQKLAREGDHLFNAGYRQSMGRRA